MPVVLAWRKHYCEVIVVEDVAGSNGFSVNFYQNDLSIYSCDDKFKLHIVIGSFLTFVKWRLSRSKIITS